MIGTERKVTVKKSRKMRWTGHVARTGEEIGAYRLLSGTTSWWTPLGRQMHRGKLVLELMLKKE